MKEIRIARTLKASPSAVWRVLADYGGIHRWNRSVTASHSTNGLDTGLGAQRYCKMAPAGSLTETITQWRPEALLVVRIDQSTLIPIGDALVYYALSVEDAGRSTTMEIRYLFETKWGVLGRLISPMVGKKLAESFENVLTDLEAAAQ